MATAQYDTTFIPHSKTPDKQRFYEWLLANGWQFASTTAEWSTPADEVYQARGRLCWLPDFSRAWIQPPSTVPGNIPKPILTLHIVDGIVTSSN